MASRFQGVSLQCLIDRLRCEQRFDEAVKQYGALNATAIHESVEAVECGYVGHRADSQNKLALLGIFDTAIRR